MAPADVPDPHDFPGSSDGSGELRDPGDRGNSRGSGELRAPGDRGDSRGSGELRAPGDRGNSRGSGEPGDPCRGHRARNPGDSTGVGLSRSRPAPSFREVRLPDDVPALLGLDTSFRTDAVFEVTVEATEVRLRTVRLAEVREKRFPLEEEWGPEPSWDLGLVALLGDPGAIVGFVALRWERWNRRAAVWHLYVDAKARGAGVGRSLLAEAARRAGNEGLRCLWLEVTSVNLPAIGFYERVGFRLCGLDATLYDPAGEAGDECALFFFRPIDPV